MTIGHNYHISKLVVSSYSSSSTSERDGFLYYSFTFVFELSVRSIDGVAFFLMLIDPKHYSMIDSEGKTERERRFTRVTYDACIVIFFYCIAGHRQ